MDDSSLPGYDPLENDFRDQLATIGKGVVSLIPLLGGPLAEIVGQAIPNQRADRVAAYLRELQRRVDNLADELKAQLKQSAAKIDLIEEGGYQAARATSSERIEQIVAAVANGLKENDVDVLRRRRLLIMFGELDGDEVALLNAYGRSYGGGDRNAFASMNRPGPVHLQSKTEELERDRLYNAGREHLLRLGLLQRNYGHLKKGQVPEFDARSGDFKHSIEISLLGRMLLKEIGLPTPFDQARDG